MTDESPQDEHDYRNLLEDSAEISLGELTEALTAGGEALTTRHLVRLSQLEGEQANAVAAVWRNLEPARQYRLVEDLDDLARSTTLVDFSWLYALAIERGAPNVQQAAIHALWDSEDPRLIRPLLEALDSDDDDLAAAAAHALGRFVLLAELGKLTKARHAQLVDALRAAYTADDAPSVVQQAAIQSLGYAADDDISDWIASAYDRDGSAWLSAAVAAMGHTGDPRWAAQVLDQLDSPDSDIRLEAVRAAGELALEGAEELLLLYLKDDNDDVRHAAIWSLSEVGDKDTRGALEAAREETDDLVEKERLDEAIDNISFRLGLIDFNMLETPNPDDN